MNDETKDKANVDEVNKAEGTGETNTVPPCPEGQVRNDKGECVKKDGGNDTHPTPPTP